MDTPELNPDPPEHAAYVNHTPPADAAERGAEAVAAALTPVAALNAVDAEPRAAPAPAPAPTGALTSQIGGNHYTKRKIQPITYAMKNELGFVEGTVCKYVTRWRDKGGIPDLEKAIDVLMKYVAHLHDEAAEALRNPA